MKRTSDFDEIFWEHKDMVMALGYKYFKNEPDAKDLVQEVFLKVYLHLPSFNHKSSLKTWIYRIAINEALNQIKKNKKHENYCLPEQVEDRGESLEEKRIVVELIKKSQRFIKLLPDKRAKVILLRLFEGHSYREIAEILETSEESAKSLYALGIKEIREKMEVEYGNG